MMEEKSFMSFGCKLTSVCFTPSTADYLQIQCSPGKIQNVAWVLLTHDWLECCWAAVCSVLPLYVISQQNRIHKFIRKTCRNIAPGHQWNYGNYLQDLTHHISYFTYSYFLHSSTKEPNPWHGWGAYIALMLCFSLSKRTQMQKWRAGRCYCRNY